METSFLSWETVPKDGYDCFFSREVYDKNTISPDYLEFLKIKDKEINDRQLGQQDKEVTITVPADSVINSKTTESSLLPNQKEDVRSTTKTSHANVKAEQDDSSKKSQAMPDSKMLERQSISKELPAYKPTPTDIPVLKPTLTRAPVPKSTLARVPVSKLTPADVPVLKPTPTRVPVPKPTPTRAPVSKSTPTRAPVSKPTPIDEATKKPIPSEETLQKPSSYEAAGQMGALYEAPTLYMEASVQKPSSNEGPVKKPSLKVPYPRPSWLTRAEQTLYIGLYNKFLICGVQPSPAEIKHFQDLHLRVAAEQEEYMSYLQMVATKYIEDYTCIQPEVDNYIAKYLEKSRRRVVDYSRFYVQYESVSLQPSRRPPHIPFVHQQLLLEMGKVSLVTVPNLNVPNRPKLRLDAKKLNRVFPPTPPDTTRNESTSHHVCSGDENAAKLAKKNRINIVVSSSALQCLVDNFAPAYSQQWEMPVIVKQYSITNDSGEEEVHKVVYVDKPFTPKVLHPRDKNMMYYKCGLKLKLQNPNGKVTFSDLRKLQETSSSQPDTPLDPRSLDPAANRSNTTGVFDSTSIEDLETFGMSYKKHKGKAMKHSDKQDSSSIKKISGLSTGNVQVGLNMFDSVSAISPTRDASGKMGIARVEKNVTAQSDEEKNDLESDRSQNLDILDQLDGTSDSRGRGRRSSPRVQQKSAGENLQTGQQQNREISTSNRMVTRHQRQLEMSNDAGISGEGMTKNIPKRKHTSGGEPGTGYSDNEVKEPSCNSPATRGKRRKHVAAAMPADMTISRTRNTRHCKSRNVCQIPTRSNTTNRISESTDSDSEGRLFIDVQDTSQSDLDERMMIGQDEADPEKMKDELKADLPNFPIASTPKTVTKLESDKEDAQKLQCANNPSPGFVSPRRKRGRPPKRQKEKLAEANSLATSESEIQLASAERIAAIPNVDETGEKNETQNIAECDITLEEKTNVVDVVSGEGNNSMKITRRSGRLASRRDTTLPLALSDSLNESDQGQQPEVTNTHDLSLQCTSRVELSEGSTNPLLPATQTLSHRLVTDTIKSEDEMEIPPTLFRENAEIKVLYEGPDIPPTLDRMDSLVDSSTPSLQSAESTDTKFTEPPTVDTNATLELLSPYEQERRPIVETAKSPQSVCTSAMNCQVKLARLPDAIVNPVIDTSLQPMRKASIIQNQPIRTRKKVVSSSVVGSPLDQILQEQQKLHFKPKIQRPATVPSNPPCPPHVGVDSIPPSHQEYRQGQPPQAREEDSKQWDMAEDLGEYKQPYDRNVTYNIWKLGDIKLLIRCGYHGYVKSPGKPICHVHLMPKLEYQLQHGVEQVTASEAARAWMALLIRNNSKLLRVRIDMATNEMFMLDELEYKDVFQPKRVFHRDAVTEVLHNVFQKLLGLPVGEYLLSHTHGNPQAQIKKTTQSERGVYDAHLAYTEQSTMAASARETSMVPLWLPIDTSVLLPFHKKYNRVPCTFEPKDLVKHQPKKSSKKKKKKKGKGKGKKK